MPTLPLSLLALQPSLLPRSLTTTGPHPPLTTTHPNLTHTVYVPAALASLAAPVPAIVWANDACATTTTAGIEREDPYAQLNREVASWGFAVFACGEAVDAVGVLSGEARDGGAWARVESGAVGMLGSRCGGAGVYAAAEDARVLSLAVLDVSGEGTSTEETRRRAASATKPVFFFKNSAVTPSAGAQGEGTRADFVAVAQGVPAWFGVLPGTDAETLKEGGAGKLGRAVRFWASWMLKGEEGRGGSAFFTEEGAEGEGWTGEGRGLGVLVL